MVFLAAATLLFARGGYGQSLSRFTFSEAIMGTEFRIVLYGADAAAVERAVAAAMLRGREIDSLLSDWRSDSELSRLARLAGADTCVAASQDLMSVLEYAQDVAVRSGGAFDVTIGPMSRLWRWAMRRGHLPPEPRLVAARKAVGHEKLIVDFSAGCIRLTTGEMRLDLGGIAKGYAADEMLRTLTPFGITIALVDAGGDIVAGNRPPAATGWVVETRSIGGDGSRETDVLYLANAAVATSGDRYRYLDADGIRYSHLLDPRTGFGLTQRRHVTVVAPSGMEADALASAISVIGEAGLHLAERPGYGARILDGQGPETKILEVGILKD
jgi:thiamine biosynthesis lipoprotein